MSWGFEKKFLGQCQTFCIKASSTISASVVSDPKAQVGLVAFRLRLGLTLFGLIVVTSDRAAIDSKSASHPSR